MERQQTPTKDVYIRDKIQNIFVTYIIPLNILPIFGKYSEHVLVTQDHEHVKAAVAKGGDSLGATELLNRLYRYKGWYQCLLSVLRDPDVKMSHVAQMMEDALAPRKKQRDSTVSTSEAHGAFQLSTNSISVEGFDSDIKCSAWNPVNGLLAVGCADARARIRNMGEHTDGSGSLLTLDHKDRGSTTTSHVAKVTSLDWARDGTYLATSCSEGITKMWTRDGNLIKTFGQNDGSIDSVKWSRGGTYILTTARKDSWVVTLYDAENGSCVQKFPLDSGYWDGCFVDWQNDNTFASRVNKRSINIYSTGAQTPVKTLKGHTLIINDIKWDPQGQLLASCSDDETVKIWDMKNDQPIHNLRGHTKFVLNIKWSPTGPGTDSPNQNLVLASASQDKTVCLWDVQNGTCMPQLATRHTESVKKLAFSPDGRYIASGDADDFVCIWDVQTGSLTHSYRINEPEVKPSILDMYWTHRGDKLVAPTRNGPVNVCDLRMMMPHRQLDS